MVPLSISSRVIFPTRKVFAFCFNDLKSVGLIACFFGGEEGFCLRHNIHSIELEAQTSSWPLWESDILKSTGYKKWGAAQLSCMTSSVWFIFLSNYPFTFFISRVPFFPSHIHLVFKVLEMFQASEGHNWSHIRGSPKLPAMHYP